MQDTYRRICTASPCYCRATPGLPFSRNIASCSI